MSAPAKQHIADANPVREAIRRGLDVLGKTQHETGSWKGDYGGPLFLLPMYVTALHVTGTPLEPSVRDGLVKHLTVHQNPDGGWGLDVESPSLVFTSVTNYVALRLLGLSVEDPMLKRARAWFSPRGGALTAGSWGKFVLAVLGLYDYEGLDPTPPELWLLPYGLPAHPARMWCHARMVYLPMSWLYGRRAKAPDSPLQRALRDEIYDEPYAHIDWRAARDRIALSDSYTPHSRLVKSVHALLDTLEPRLPKSLREKALTRVLAHISNEDLATNYICIGPVNKVYNTLVWHFAKPGGPEVKAHLARLPDYLYRGDDGLKMNGYNSSELWDTAFSVQAIAATGEVARARETLTNAQRFIEANQVLVDSPDAAQHYRHPSKGGWPFSTRSHGWPISDCTAEGLKATLTLDPMALDAAPISRERRRDAVDLILSMQNDDGGWATYELIRGPKWLERLNPSDTFADIMIEYSYVECTSACIQALTAFERAHPDLAPTGLRRAVERGAEFIRRIQKDDGSWEGSWGVCFTYGTWFGVWGLISAGAKPGDAALERAVKFLLAHQQKDGGWGETIESCRQRRYVHAEEGQAVMTSWALLALAKAGYRDHDATRRGVDFLLRRQQDDGRWPPEHIAGVFNKTCAIHYDAYLRIFPVWALAVCG
ncbi:MAG: 2,3-oxidosqualene cyclase [Myxococcaceae bacterium]